MKIDLFCCKCKEQMSVIGADAKSGSVLLIRFQCAICKRSVLLQVKK